MEPRKDRSAHPDWLRYPLKYPPGSRVFVTSMGDIFHGEVTDEFRHRVFAVMNACHGCRFIVLTKRPERMAEMDRTVGSAFWVGATPSVSGADWRYGGSKIFGEYSEYPVHQRRKVPEELGANDLAGIHQVLVGGESGPGYRQMEMACAVTGITSRDVGTGTEGQIRQLRMNF
jgi:protein gp37